MSTAMQQCKPTTQVITSKVNVIDRLFLKTTAAYLKVQVMRKPVIQFQHGAVFDTVTRRDVRKTNRKQVSTSEDSFVRRP